MARTIVQLAPTYQTAYALRDKVLMQTRTGRRWASTYYAHVDELHKVAATNPEIATRFRNAWIRVHPFVKGVVDATSGGSPNVRLSGENYQAVQDVLHRLRDASNDTGFRRAVERFDAGLGAYVNLTAQEALRKLGRAGTE